MIKLFEDLWIGARFNLRGRGGRNYVLATIPRDAICAEIGVWQGDLSAQILATGRVSELHLIDPWAFQPDFPARLYGGALAKSQADMDTIFDAVRQRFSGAPQAFIHRGNSTTVAAQFPDRHFDWIYVDGDHSYHAVLDDLTAWHRKVKLGGTICLDDYRWRDETGRFSVKDAIDAFLRRQPMATARHVGGQFIMRAAAGATT